MAGILLDLRLHIDFGLTLTCEALEVPRHPRVPAATAAAGRLAATTPTAQVRAAAVAINLEVVTVVEGGRFVTEDAVARGLNGAGAEATVSADEWWGISVGRTPPLSLSLIIKEDMFQANPSNNYVATKKVIIKPENQGIYGLRTNNKQLKFHITPQQSPFIDTSQTYLRMTLEMKGSMLNYKPCPSAAAHSIFHDMRLTDGNNNAVIEELQEMNTMIAQYYDYTAIHRNSGISPA